MTTHMIVSKETTLYTLSDDFQSGSTVVMYEPVRHASPGEHQWATLRRGGMNAFSGVAAKFEHDEAGLTTFDAPSAPGNQSQYPYMLLREIGTFDCDRREFIPAAAKAGALVGMMASEAMAIDLRPGLYYTTARTDDTQPRTAFLVGPFAQHIEALLHVQPASNYIREQLAQAQWWFYGTTRTAVDAEFAPRGKLNDVLLTMVERAALPGAPLTHAVIDIKDTATAAFDDLGVKAEVARIFESVAERVRQEPDLKSLVLDDTNGNPVGHFRLATNVPVSDASDAGVHLVVDLTDRAFAACRHEILADVVRDVGRRIAHADNNLAFVVTGPQGQPLGECVMHIANDAVLEEGRVGLEV